MIVDTAARLLRLLSLLQSQERWTGAALGRLLEVSSRTVRADIERLRSLDYQVDAIPGASGGYRLRAGTALPPLQLDDDEAIAVAVALRTAATSGVTDIGETAARAVTKLERVLPSRLRNRLRALDEAVDTVPKQRDPVESATMSAVAECIQRTEELRFEYVDRHRARSGRRVEPHRLVHVSGRWYLVAYDLDRDDWRSYRVDRITPKIPTGPRFARRALPGPDLATFVTRGRMAALWNYRARVIVDAPAETVMTRIPAGIWAVEPIDEQRSGLDAGAQTPELLAAYLGALGLDFHIDAEAFPDLSMAAARLADRYAAASR